MLQMLRTTVFRAAAILALIAPGARWIAAPSPAPDEPLRTVTGNQRAAPGSCTILTVSKGGVVFYGNNEDWINPNTYIWSRSPEGGYRGVYYGFDDLFPQGGVNEEGLTFDWNALPEMRLNPSRGLPPAPDKFGEHLLASTATVEEAIAYIRGLSWGPVVTGQIHLADGSGDAAVMGAGPDGVWAVTRKEPGDSYLVSTNFPLPAPQVGGYPCARYDRATAMLDQVVGGDELAADDIAEILSAVHQEGAGVNTVYASAIDLSRGILYLYHWYQFQEPFAITVEAAIDRFAEPTPIRQLFSQETVARAERAYQRHLTRVDRVNNAAKVWLALVVLSLLTQLVLTARRRGEMWIERLSWVLGALFLGPIALAVRVLDLRLRGGGDIGEAVAPRWIAATRAAVIRTSTYAFAVLLSVPYFVLVRPSPGPVDILVATYAVPLIVVWLVLRGPLYAAGTGASYGSGLRQLALSDLTAHNLVFGATIPTFFLLSSTWFPGGVEASNPLVWVGLAVATLAGLLADLPFEAWLAHQGIPLWPWRAPGGSEVAPPRSLDLRAGWPILAISFAFAVGMLALAVAQLF